MSATDNILAGIAGFGEGIRDVLVPYTMENLKEQREERLLRKKALHDIEGYKMLLPYKQAEEKYKANLNFDTQNKLKEAEFDREQNAMVDVLDVGTGKKLGTAKRGSIKTGVDFEDKSSQAEKEILIKNLTTQLPDLKQNAMRNKTNLQAIKKAKGLLEKGVSGKLGQVKSFLASYADFAGENVDSLSEAQTYQLLTRVITGPMRLEIIGPGPVSEYEQKLMQAISGGGGAAKGSAKELLNFYEKKAKDNVSNYNSTLDGAKKLSPYFEQVYSSVDLSDLEEKDVIDNGNQAQPKEHSKRKPLSAFWSKR